MDGERAGEVQQGTSTGPSLPPWGLLSLPTILPFPALCKFVVLLNVAYNVQDVAKKAQTREFLNFCWITFMSSRFSLLGFLLPSIVGIFTSFNAVIFDSLVGLNMQKS